MSEKVKGILINSIISKLNDCIRQDNKNLVEHNLHSEQKPLHGAEMFFKLAYMSDEVIKEIAKNCGV